MRQLHTDDAQDYQLPPEGVMEQTDPGPHGRNQPFQLLDFRLRPQNCGVKTVHFLKVNNINFCCLKPPTSPRLWCFVAAASGNKRR